MVQKTRNRLTEGWGDNTDDRKTCLLMISHSCNLNCVYCYEQFKSEQKMSFSDATSFILKEAEKIQQSKKYNELEIDLMGGEPMTHFPLIQQLVEWAEEGHIPVPWIFSMTTNGTLFTQESKLWFREHKESIVVSLSYDGTEAMQQKNRGTKSNTIDLDFFLRCWPEQGVHLTLSPDSLPHFAEGVLQFQRQGVPVDASLAEELNWTHTDALLYREQLEELAEIYLQDDTLPFLNILCRPLDLVQAGQDKRRIDSFCGAGTGMIAYDTDGKTYGCHIFSPIVLGSRALELEDMRVNLTDIQEDSECNLCVLKHFCPTCAGFNFRDRGNIRERDKRKCAMHLVEAEVSAKFQIKLLAKEIEKFSQEEAEYASQAINALSILDNLKQTQRYPCF